MTDYEMRLDAAHKGETRYAGKPCAIHPKSERYTSNGACVECTGERANARVRNIREILRNNRAS